MSGQQLMAVASKNGKQQAHKHQLVGHKVQAMVHG